MHLDVRLRRKGVMDGRVGRSLRGAEHGIDPFRLGIGVEEGRQGIRYMRRDHVRG